jgi:hypothetical protein
LSEEPEIAYRFEGLAQQNFFAFAKDSSDPFLSDNLGRGSLAVDDENLEAEATIFEAAFSPVPVLATLQNSRTMGRVFTGDKYQFDGFTFNLIDPVVIRDFSPRVALLSEAEASLDILIGANAINYEVNQSALDFNRALTTNWRLLSTATDRAKIVKALFLLDLSDVEALDFTRPVYVEYFGEYFYIQKIEQFKPDRRESCFVTLVKIGQDG